MAARRYPHYGVGRLGLFFSSSVQISITQISGPHPSVRVVSQSLRYDVGRLKQTGHAVAISCAGKANGGWYRRAKRTPVHQGMYNAQILEKKAGGNRGRKPGDQGPNSLRWGYSQLSQCPSYCADDARLTRASGLRLDGRWTGGPSINM